MMKRNILAVLIPTLLAAGTAHSVELLNKDGNSLELYGEVKGELQYNNSNDLENNVNDLGYVRLGVKGKTQIARGINGYGTFEHQFDANMPEASDDNKQQTRLAFVGLEFGQWGTVDYGRNYGVIYDTLEWTDKFPLFGGDQAVNDVQMLGRASNLLTYRVKNAMGYVPGLNFAFQYQAKNIDGNTLYNPNPISLTEAEDNRDGYGVSASYEIMGVGLAASYSATDRTDAQRNSAVGGSLAEAWSVATRYNDNNIYTAVSWTETHNTAGAEKTRGLEAVVQYKFDFGFTPSLGYSQIRRHDDMGNSEYFSKYVSLGAMYDFNSNFSTAIEYKLNQLSDDTAYQYNKDDLLGVGITYKF